MKITLLNALNESGMLGSGSMLTGIGVGMPNNPGYIYSIRGDIPKHDMEQKPNKHKEEYYVHVGSRVQGKGFNNPKKKYTGRIVRIIKDSNGVIQGLYLRTDKTARHITIRPDGLKYLKVKDDPPKPRFQISPQYNMNLH